MLLVLAKHGLQPRDIRRCEERSNVAVYEYMDCFAALSMTVWAYAAVP